MSKIELEFYHIMIISMKSFVDEMESIRNILKNISESLEKGSDENE